MNFLYTEIVDGVFLFIDIQILLELSIYWLIGEKLRLLVYSPASSNPTTCHNVNRDWCGSGRSTWSFSKPLLPSYMVS